jgi:hypothetical protein
VNGLRRSTVRSYASSVAAFCWYVTDPAYGWTGQCQARFDTHPVQVVHEWNTAVYVQQNEADPRKRPAEWVSAGYHAPGVSREGATSEGYARPERARSGDRASGGAARGYARRSGKECSARRRSARQPAEPGSCRAEREHSAPERRGATARSVRPGELQDRRQGCAERGVRRDRGRSRGGVLIPHHPERIVSSADDARGNSCRPRNHRRSVKDQDIRAETRKRVPIRDVSSPGGVPCAAVFLAAQLRRGNPVCRDCAGITRHFLPGVPR